MSFFLRVYERQGRGIVNGQRASKVKGCQADVSSHLSSLPPSVFFSILCSFFIFCIGPAVLGFFCTFYLNSSFSLLFFFTLGVWEHCRPLPQLEPSRKASRDISVIIKPALRLPNTSSLMCTSTSQIHTCTHHLAECSNRFSDGRSTLKKKNKKYPLD